MTSNKYLQKLAKRKFDESLKTNLIFGLTLGWVLTLMGAFKYYIQLEQGWILGMSVGLLLLLTALVVPQLLEKPQELIKKVGGFVATQLFRVFLDIAP